MSQSVNRAINKAAESTAILMLATMLGLVLLQIVGRYLFQNPPPWTEEAARFCMVWCGLLGAGSALFRRADPKLTNGIRSHSRSVAWLLRSGRLLAISMFIVPWIAFGIGFVGRHSYRVTESMNWNSAIVVIVIPIAALILLLHAASQFFAPAVEDRSDDKGSV